MKLFLLFSLCGFLSLACYGVQGGKVIETDLFSFSGTNLLSEFRSPDPNVVKVDWEKKSGTLILNILRKDKKNFQIVGPKVKGAPENRFISKRKLVTSLQMQITPNPVSRIVKIRLLTPDGKYAEQFDKHKQPWCTVFSSEASSGWKHPREETQFGLANPKYADGQFLIELDTAAAPCEIRIRNLVIKEQAHINHRFTGGRKDFIFFADSGVLNIEPFRWNDVSGGSVTACDEEGKIVGIMPFPVGRKSFEFSLPRRGFYLVRAEAVYKSGECIVSEQNAAVTGPKIPENLRKQSRYGIFPCWVPLSWVKEHGFHLANDGWKLDNIKPGKDGKLEFTGKPKNTENKEIFTFGHHFGHLPDYLLKPEDRNDRWIMAPPADWKMLEEAVRLWARNTPELPSCVVVANEPNAHWKGTAEEMVRYHNTVCDAVKKERPEVKVGGPAFYSIDMPYFKDLVRRGILRNMDILVMHAYVNATPPEGEFIAKVIAMQNFLAHTEYRNLPIAITEFGWTGPRGDWQKPVSELTKARYTARSHILLTARNIRWIIHFVAQFYETEDELNYSLVRADGTPLPAYSAIQAMMRELIPVREGGTILSLAPGVFGCVFRRNGDTLATFWTEDGSPAVLKSTIAPHAVRGMNGESRKTAKNFDLTPSPIYTDFPGTGLADLIETAVQPVLHGDSVFIGSADDMILPPGMESVGPGHLRILPEARLGVYTVPVRKGDKWTAHRFEIRKLFQTSHADIVWNGKQEKHPELIFRSVSKAHETIPVKIEVKLHDGRILNKVFQHPPGEFLIPVKMPEAVNGKRYSGTFTLTSRNPAFSTSCKFDGVALAFPRFTNGKQDWNKIPPVPLHEYLRKGETIPKMELSPAKGWLRMYASPSGLHLRIAVNDREHRQKKRGIAIWREDSVQLAFDLDADQPWDANYNGGGLNGHRIVEYGFASNPRNPDRPQCWRWLAYVDRLQPGPADELAEFCKVTRNEQAKETLYQILIPWKYLGAETSPGAQNRIGFSLLINDMNRDGKRRVLPYVHGILCKEVEKFAKIRFTDRK